MTTISKEQDRLNSIARYEAKLASGEIQARKPYEKSAKHQAFDKREADKAASIASYDSKIVSGEIKARVPYVKSEKAIAYAAQVAKVAAVKAGFAKSAKARKVAA